MIQKNMHEQAVQTTFLGGVATELIARYAPHLRDFVIVTPNKRSVTFLGNAFSERLAARVGREAEPGEMPRLVTITQFTERVSGLKKGSHLELLFTLFDAYRSMPGVKDADFDKFRQWGETVLSDFNDVDMYDVNPEALFKNLVDYNAIQADYLTDEQRRVIEQYFGVPNPAEHVRTFWRHFNPKGKIEETFLGLWTLLAPLYRKFNALLLDQGLGYPGLLFKKACEKIESGKFAYGSRKRIIFVGFNALSTIERRLFRDIQKRTAPLLEGDEQLPGKGKVRSQAEFFWDAPGPALAEDSPVDAGHFLRRNARDFPCSLSGMEKYSDFPDFPAVMEQIACPGNTAQAKVASGIVAQMDRDQLDLAKVAVVLPDEGLLFPVFHSLPGNIVDAANITMGYPLKLTAVASFVNLLRQLYQRGRSQGGGETFFAEDVKALLNTPLLRTMLGHEQSKLLLGTLLTSRIFFISAPQLIDLIKEEATEETLRVIDAIFTPLPKTDEPAQVCSHICNILRLAIDAIDPLPEDAPAEAASMHTIHLQAYLQAFEEFGALCQKHRLRMPPRTALQLAYRTLSSATIPLQGEPLMGLQIMGMLETRALDFEALIIPSMNERIFPRRLRPKTFIPDTLRLGYGMATTRFQEEIFAYHFYRLIARARKVYLLYDASQGGTRSGDPSRYLLQLEYLFGPKAHLKKRTARYMLNSQAEPDHTVPKTPAVMERLSRYTSGEKTLSASALKSYLKCPVMFAVHHVLDQYTDNPPSEHMDAAEIGDAMHHSMQYLYDTLHPSIEHPATVTRETIDGWLSNAGPFGEYSSIEDIVDAQIRKVTKNKFPEGEPLPEDALLHKDAICTMVRECLEADLRIAPFEYLSSERPQVVTYEMEDGRKIRMKMIIDRLDRITLPDGTKRLRIVDYKTGSDSMEATKMADLFSKNGAIFQLMLYATLLPQAMPQAEGQEIILSIYKPFDLIHRDYNSTVSIGGNPVLSHLPYLNDFREQLDRMLTVVLDSETPFTPPKDMPDIAPGTHKPCSYCPYVGLCMG